MIGHRGTEEHRLGAVELEDGHGGELPRDLTLITKSEACLGERRRRSGESMASSTFSSESSKLSTSSPLRASMALSIFGVIVPDKRTCKDASSSGKSSNRSKKTRSSISSVPLKSAMAASATSVGSRLGIHGRGKLSVLSKVRVFLWRLKVPFASILKCNATPSRQIAVPMDRNHSGERFDKVVRTGRFRPDVPRAPPFQCENEVVGRGERRDDGPLLVARQTPTEPAVVGGESPRGPRTRWVVWVGAGVLTTGLLIDQLRVLLVSSVLIPTKTRPSSGMPGVSF